MIIYIVTLFLMTLFYAIEYQKSSNEYTTRIQGYNKKIIV